MRSSRAVNESVTARHIVLATGPRRPMREAVIVVMSARIVLSMSAPSATQRPVETGMTPAVTRPEVMITAARLEKQPAPSARAEQYGEDRRVGDLEEERRELRARAQRHRGGHDEAERKHDDAKADQDAAELALTRVRLAHEEEAGADENQERRQERKVEGEHAGHQGRTEVGAENRREGHVGGEKAFGLQCSPR